mmetsp:Transcript_19063/g.44533  ORF Transcript_19063/g.44533 Transcript_19063/m.44533 type:complete len:755 (-) Transcript_19063:56-2320(-)
MDVPAASSSSNSKVLQGDESSCTAESQDRSKKSPAPSEKRSQSAHHLQARFHFGSGSSGSAEGRKLRASFSSLGELDEPSLSLRLKLYILSWRFDALMCFIIAANAALIGIEQQWSVEYGDNAVPKALTLMEHVFLILFVLELIVRAVAIGRAAARSGWWLFDALLVTAGVVFSWVGPLVSGRALKGTAVVMTLRLLRMIRIARVFHILVRFRTLAMLAKGLQNCITTVLCTCMLLMLILYMASTISMEIITKHSLAVGPEADPEFQEHVALWFRSLPVTMLTLMQFVTLDNMNLVYLPLVLKDWRLSGFFVGLVLVISIILMNIITGVVVNSAMEASLEDRERVRKTHEIQRKKALMKELKRVFRSLDADGDGKLTREEIEEVLNVDDGQEDTVLRTFGVDPLEVYDMLSPTDTGLDIVEFCDTLHEVMESGLELKRLEKNVMEVKALLVSLDSEKRHLAHDAKTNIVSSILSHKVARHSAGAHGFSSEGARSQRSMQSSTNGHWNKYSSSRAPGGSQDSADLNSHHYLSQSSATAHDKEQAPQWARDMAEELYHLRCSIGMHLQRTSSLAGVLTQVPSNPIMATASMGSKGPEADLQSLRLPKRGSLDGGLSSPVDQMESIGSGKCDSPAESQDGVKMVKPRKTSSLTIAVDVPEGSSGRSPPHLPPPTPEAMLSTIPENGGPDGQGRNSLEKLGSFPRRGSSGNPGLSSSEQLSQPNPLVFGFDSKPQAGDLLSKGLAGSSSGRVTRRDRL